MPKKKQDLICFDMDGTLIDSTPVQVKAFKSAVEKNKLTFPGKKKVIEHFGPGMEQVLRSLYPRISKLRSEQVIKDYIATLEKNRNLMKPFPHVKEALLKLKKKFKLGIVSNSYNEEIKERLEGAKIPTKIFEVFIGEDDAKPKPSPTGILLAEKLTNSDAKFMVGDTIYDIKAGKKAGCKTIGVLTGIHTMEQLMKASPDILASSVAILPDILLNE